MEAHLETVRALHERDTMLAAESTLVSDLAERAARVRARAGEIATALGAIPGERAALDARAAEVEERLRAAEKALADAESALADAGRALRNRDERKAAALSDLQVARETLADTESQRERIAERRFRLDEEEAALDAESGALILEARSLALEVDTAPRVAEAAKGAPGETLTDLDDWGGLVRAALFVARGVLDAERERIVIEANVLASTVLGEDVGGASVALVLERLEGRARST